MPRFLLPALIGGSVLVSLLLTGWRLSRQPDEAALDEAAAMVRSAFVDGDLVVVEPRYLVGPRQRLGDLPLWEPRILKASDVVGVRRVHLLTVDAIGFADRQAAALAEFGRVVEDCRFGDTVRWRSYQLVTRRSVVFDLWQEVERARVTARYPDGSEHTCERWDRDRWVCPRNPGWNYVGRRSMDIDAQPRDCVWMHPINRGGLLTIELPSLVVGNDTALVGGYGFSFGSARRVAAPVRGRVLAGDVEIMSFKHRPDRGWVPFEQALPKTDAPLRIELETDNNGVSHFCMALRLVEPVR